MALVLTLTLCGQLLNQMDGFDSLGRTKLIMATNRPDTLDPALLRPGRLDRKIEIPLPNEQARLEILRIHAAPVNKGGDIDYEAIVKVRARGLRHAWRVADAAPAVGRVQRRGSAECGDGGGHVCDPRRQVRIFGGGGAVAQLTRRRAQGVCEPGGSDKGGAQGRGGEEA